MPVPRCSALRRDGQPCGALASAPDATFCRHHERLVDLHGDEAVRVGDYPRTRNPRPEVMVAVETEGNGRGANLVVSPSDVRPALARAAAGSLDAIQEALLDAALGASREHWITVTCTSCGQKHRTQVAIPDVRSRVAAIELLLREGLGRPAQAEEPHHATLPTTGEGIQQLSWTDLQAVFAVEFTEQIQTVVTGGSVTVIQERLREVGEEGRTLLREALEGLDVPAA
jgi:hypothetical protein